MEDETFDPAVRRRSGALSFGARLSSRDSALPIPSQWSWRAPGSTLRRRASLVTCGRPIEHALRIRF